MKREKRLKSVCNSILIQTQDPEQGIGLQICSTGNKQPFVKARVALRSSKMRTLFFVILLLVLNPCKIIAQDLIVHQKGSGHISFGILFSHYANQNEKISGKVDGYYTFPIDPGIE